MAGNVKELTDGNFMENIKTGVTLVDFWAPWCAPCRAQGPVVDKLADAFAGKAVVGKINVDENAEMANKFQVMNIPTLIIFRDGREVNRLIGLQQETDLNASIQKALL